MLSKIVFVFIASIWDLAKFIQGLRLRTDCKILQNQEFKRLCISKYPTDLLIKYKDEMVKPKEICAIFQFPEDYRNHFFVSFGESTTINCALLQVTHWNSFRCKNSDGVWKDIGAVDGFIICIQLGFDPTDDLIRYCSPYNLRPTQFVALHYSTIDRTGSISVGYMKNTSLILWIKFIIIISLLAY